MKRLNLSPLTSVFRYYNYTTVYRILRDQVDCPELKDLFVSRELMYNIRNPRPIQEDCHSTNYAFYSPIARLHRAWNSLPKNLRSIVRIGQVKRAIRAFEAE